MVTYLPDTWQSIEDIIKGTVLTANELELVRLFRSATGNSDPKPAGLEPLGDNHHGLRAQSASEENHGRRVRAIEGDLTEAALVMRAAVAYSMALKNKSDSGPEAHFER